MDFLCVQFQFTTKQKDELIILKKYLEKILFGGSSNLIQQIGEHYLFRSIEYLEKLINNS